MSSGVQILNPAKINALTKSTQDFNDLWKQLIDLKEIKCSKNVLDSWYSVDDLADFSANDIEWITYINPSGEKIRLRL